MGTPDENKHVVLRQIEALNAGDAETRQRLAHPDFFDHGEPRPDDAGRLEPLDIVAEDDRVVVRARSAGEESELQQIHIWRLVGGLIVEHWEGSDGRDQRGKGAL
jgi:hypothetical protein